MSKRQLITLDFETYYDPVYSLKKMPTAAYIRDERFKVHGCGVQINDREPRWVTAAKLPYLFSKLPWEDTYMIGHNLHFDGAILNWHYGYAPRRYIDTLGMSRAMFGQHFARHGLDALGQALFGSGKRDGLAGTMGIRDLPPELEHRLGVYCCDDVAKTWRLFRLLQPHFPRQEYKLLDWVTRQFVQPMLYMDAELLEAYLVDVRQMKVDALRNAGLEDRKMLMSNPQYAEALIQLGVMPPVKFNKKGKVTFAFAKTDEEHKALLEHEDPQVQALVAARLELKSTIEETRTVSYLAMAPTGPWPVDYKYSGAQNTHRLSGADGGGGNPTNLKRGGTLRKCIYAPEGYKLLVGDLSQIECRIVLWLGSHMPNSTGAEAEALEVMRQGGDLYCYFATLMYGRPINKKDHPLERQIAKSAVLGLGFGMGAARFLDYCKSMGIKITATEAESAVALYRNTYKGVTQLWRRIDKLMKLAMQGQQGFEAAQAEWNIPATKLVREPLFGHLAIATGHGLMLKYPDLEVDAEGQVSYRDGNRRVNIFGGKYIENVVQNLARNVMMDAAMDIDDTFPVLMSTYDELVALVEDDTQYIAQATAFITERMTREHPTFPGLPLGVETGVAVRYGDAKN
jgi:hypothetical protein